MFSTIVACRVFPVSLVSCKLGTTRLEGGRVDYKIAFQCPGLGDLCFGMYKMKKELLEGLSTVIQNIESFGFRYFISAIF